MIALGSHRRDKSVIKGKSRAYMKMNVKHQNYSVILYINNLYKNISSFFEDPVSLKRTWQNKKLNRNLRSYLN